MRAEQSTSPSPVGSHVLTGKGIGPHALPPGLDTRHVSAGGAPLDESGGMPAGGAAAR